LSLRTVGKAVDKLLDNARIPISIDVPGDA
jgi:hypothetical protein